MVADTIEAKARLMTRPDRESIQKMVNETLRTIMADGQLDESDLSLRDIKGIAESFTTTLMGIYHSRVEYPKDMMQNLPSREPSTAASAILPLPAETVTNGTSLPAPSGVESTPSV